jgi:hypothetical protein
MRARCWSVVLSCLGPGGPLGALRHSFVTTMAKLTTSGRLRPNPETEILTKRLCATAMRRAGGPRRAVERKDLLALPHLGLANRAERSL